MFCEQTAATCLIVTLTSFVPRTWAMCMAQRHKWLHHAGQCRAEKAGGTLSIIVMVQIKLYTVQASTDLHISPSNGVA